MKTKISLIIIFSFLLFSCSSDNLDRTIFIPDEDDPELPAYTEWGYNSFGAFYERDKISSTNSIVPCKIVYRNDTLNFSLIGRYASKETALTFSFPLSKEVENIEDLSVLHDFKIDLKGEECTVKLEENSFPITLEILNGELYFKRFQLLWVDEKVNRIILSGTFELRFLKNGRPESITNGRFDMGITDKDFYNYNN